MYVKAVAVGPLDGYRIWVRFDDGLRGELDLAHLVDTGMYKWWKDRRLFESVRVSPHGEIVWYTPDHDIDFCPDWAYREITGLSMDELRAEKGKHKPGPIRRWQRKRWSN